MEGMGGGGVARATAFGALEFAGGVGGGADDGAGATASGGGIKASAASADALFRAAAVLGARGAIFATKSIADAVATGFATDARDTG